MNKAVLLASMLALAGCVAACSKKDTQPASATAASTTTATSTAQSAADTSSGSAADDAAAPTTPPKSSTTTEDAAMAKALPRNKTPKPKRIYEPGPALSPGQDLVAWFKANPDEYVRIPVVIHFDEGLRQRKKAYIALDPKAAEPADAVVLNLDDSTLGISLSSRLRSLCPEGPSCVIWVEGHWGSVGVGLPTPEPTSPPPWPFTVRDTLSFDTQAVDATAPTIFVGNKTGNMPPP